MLRPALPNVPASGCEKHDVLNHSVLLFVNPLFGLQPDTRFGRALNAVKRKKGSLVCGEKGNPF